MHPITTMPNSIDTITTDSRTLIMDKTISSSITPVPSSILRSNERDELGWCDIHYLHYSYIRCSTCYASTLHCTNLGLRIKYSHDTRTNITAQDIVGSYRIKPARPGSQSKSIHFPLFTSFLFTNLGLPGLVNVSDEPPIPVNPASGATSPEPASPPRPPLPSEDDGFS